MTRLNVDKSTNTVILVGTKTAVAAAQLYIDTHLEYLAAYDKEASEAEKLRKELRGIALQDGDYAEASRLAPPAAAPGKGGGGKGGLGIGKGEGGGGRGNGKGKGAGGRGGGGGGGSESDRSDPRLYDGRFGMLNACGGWGSTLSASTRCTGSDSSPRSSQSDAIRLGQAPTST